MFIRLLIFISFLYVSPIYAINVGSVTSFIDKDSSDIYKEIENNSEQARLITVSVARISTPEENGQIIPMEVEGELLLTPSRLVLPANSKNNIRFFYHGPKDSNERYYRVTWHDTALSLDEQRNESRQAVATTSAKIGTILVVTPRQSKFNYALENGELTNLGNASYRVVAYGICRKDPEKQCRETYYDLPGKKRKFNRVNISHENSHLGLWLGQDFSVVK